MDEGVVALSPEIVELLGEGAGFNVGVITVWFGGEKMSGELEDFGPWGVRLNLGTLKLVIPAGQLQAFEYGEEFG